MKEFKEVAKLLTEDIYMEALKRNQASLKSLIFAAGLPASGKSTHLRAMVTDELVYDGTINNESKFARFVQAGIDMGYSVEAFVYSADSGRAFKSNLERGDSTGRYVPIYQYEKVAISLNERATFLKLWFRNKIKFRNFEHTNFEGMPRRFSQINIDRNELERIARAHKFPDSKALYSVIS